MRLQGVTFAPQHRYKHNLRKTSVKNKTLDFIEEACYNVNSKNFPYWKIKIERNF